MTDWKKLIEHADGRDCKCAAYSYADCGCEADWTPKEVYKLRQRVEALETVVDAAMNHDHVIEASEEPFVCEICKALDAQGIVKIDKEDPKPVCPARVERESNDLRKRV